MLLCKQTEHPNFNEEIKSNSESIMKLEVWLVIDFEKLDRFQPLVLFIILLFIVVKPPKGEYIQFILISKW